jgi:hypothetical protein
MEFKKSLQAIKNDIDRSEEIFKLLQKSHPHLAHLSEIQILNYFHVNSIDQLHEHIQQIKASKESYYDLSVQKHEICSCRDSHGEIKNLYDSETSAQAEADTLSERYTLKLSVYRCPYGAGWHLTKG